LGQPELAESKTAKAEEFSVRDEESPFARRTPSEEGNVSKGKLLNETELAKYSLISLSLFSS
jgi:hypothetical protein